MSTLDYKFDESVDKNGKKRHNHMLKGRKIRGVTTILDILAKPQLIQWSANLAAAEGFTQAYAMLLVKEIESENAPEWNELNPPVLDAEGLKQLKGLKEMIASYEKIDSDACYEIEAKFPIFKKVRTAHNKKKQEAADWGTIVHKAIETWIVTKAIPTAVEVAGKNIILEASQVKAVEDFVKWATVENVEVLLSEQPICSEEWEVGGVVDLVIKKNGKLLIGDIKTSSGIYESYWLQCAAYAKMLEEMAGKGQTNAISAEESFDGMVIVNLKKDGTFDVQERKDVSGNIKCFEACILLSNRFSE